MSLFHHRLRQLRRERNMSQEELARKLGISRQAIIAIEQGASLPSLRVILALMDALGISFNEMFGPEWSPFRNQELTEEPETTHLSLYRHEDRAQTMPVTMYEDTLAFHLYAELAGVKEDDVTVDLSPQHVLIVAVKRTVISPQSVTVHTNDIAPGPQLRVVSMPAPIQPENAKATFTNGLLYLVLPKHHIATSRRITFQKELPTAELSRREVKEDYGSE